MTSRCVVDWVDTCLSLPLVSRCQHVYEADNLVCPVVVLDLHDMVQMESLDHVMRQVCSTKRVSKQDFRCVCMNSTV